MNNDTQYQQVDNNEIARVAYQLWEEHGHPLGRDVEFWLEAETRIRARPSAQGQSQARALRTGSLALESKTWEPQPVTLPRSGPSRTAADKAAAAGLRPARTTRRQAVSAAARG